MSQKPPVLSAVGKDLTLLYTRARLTGGAPQTGKEHLQICDSVRAFQRAADEAALALQASIEPGDAALDLDVSDLYDFRTEAAMLPAPALLVRNEDAPLQLGGAPQATWRAEWAKASRQLQSVQEIERGNPSLVLPVEEAETEADMEIARKALEGERLVDSGEVVLRVAVMQALHKSRVLQVRPALCGRSAAGPGPLWRRPSLAAAARPAAPPGAHACAGAAQAAAAARPARTARPSPRRRSCWCWAARRWRCCLTRSSAPWRTWWPRPQQQQQQQRRRQRQGRAARALLQGLRRRGAAAAPTC
jgi:hypothetical protein